MNLTVWDITPCLMVKNEDYWIYYTLRDISKVFRNIIVLDTGSTDKTKDIIKRYYPDVILVEENFGDDKNKIGGGRNVLRDLCKTHWMFLVDGDEIWREDRLQKLLACDIPLDKDVIMAGNWNIEEMNGMLQLRVHDMAGKDILFSPKIVWERTDYPFESYGLTDGFSMEHVHYVNAAEIYAWHVRTAARSTKNDDAFFRNEKLQYFPYTKEYINLPEDWLGELNLEIENRYLHDTRRN